MRACLSHDWIAKYNVRLLLASIASLQSKRIYQFILNRKSIQETKSNLYNVDVLMLIISYSIHVCRSSCGAVSLKYVEKFGTEELPKD